MTGSRRLNGAARPGCAASGLARKRWPGPIGAFPEYLENLHDPQ